MMSGGYRRTALAAAASIILAQVPAVWAANDTAVDFDIPSQAMAAALNAWAVQANAQIFVDPGPLARLTAPAIKGPLLPRQALRTLLSHSNLQFTQGVNGVYLIRARPVVALVPRPAAPAPDAESGPQAPEPAAPLAARDTEGSWLLRLNADFASGNGGVSGGGIAAVDGEYFFNDHVSGAVSMTLPRTYSFGTAGSARLQSSSVALKYYFALEQRLRPYAGAGMAITAFYDVTPAGLDHAVVGPAAEAGLDVRLDPHWMLNADVSWAQVRSGDIRVDPVRFGLGVVHRF